MLVVDDDPDIRLMLRFVLEDLGYCVLEARNGVEGLEALRAAGDQHLIVLLDYRMPRMDGWEMLRATTGDAMLAGRHTFALVTANAEALPLAFRGLLDTLAIPILAKPFHLEELDAFVGQCAARATAAGED